MNTGGDFIIYGAGGMGRECVWIAQSNVLNLDLKFFYDDYLEILSCVGVPLVKKLNSNLPIVVSIAEPKARKEIVLKLQSNYSFTNLISTTSKIHESSKIGQGCILGFDSISSVDVIISNHCLINARTIVGHDSVLEDFVSIMYNVSISGNVIIGEGTLIGSNAVILPNLKIGKWCKIGAGAVVTKDVPPYSTVVGVPGKVIKNNKIHE
jgi:sugar O-acyltransferase (sialic acid O-acetyltransferase NeuD family)